MRTKKAIIHDMEILNDTLKAQDRNQFTESETTYFLALESELKALERGEQPKIDVPQSQQPATAEMLNGLRMKVAANRRALQVAGYNDLLFAADNVGGPNTSGAGHIEQLNQGIENALWHLGQRRNGVFI